MCPSGLFALALYFIFFPKQYIFLLHCLPQFMFADDLMLLLPSTSLQSLVNAPNESLICFSNWILANKLQLDISKCKSMISNPYQKHSYLSSCCLWYSFYWVVPTAKFLGTMANHFTVGNYMLVHFAFPPTGMFTFLLQNSSYFH